MLEEYFAPLHIRPCPRLGVWGDNELTERKQRFRKIGGHVDPCVRKRRDNELTLNKFVDYYIVFIVFF